MGTAGRDSILKNNGLHCSNLGNKGRFGGSEGFVECTPCGVEDAKEGPYSLSLSCTE